MIQTLKMSKEASICNHSLWSSQLNQILNLHIKETFILLSSFWFDQLYLLYRTRIFIHTQGFDLVFFATTAS